MTRDLTDIPLDISADTDRGMVTCANGHDNPREWDTCGECGAPLGETEGLLEWLGRPGHSTAIIAAAAALVAGLALVITTMPRSDDPATGVEAKQVAVQHWWSSAQLDVDELDELDDSLDESERAIRRWDSIAFNDACQRIHDAAAVGVPAHLPAPDPQISAELSAAADDAHSASHMCLAAIAQTHNDYDGEFTAATEQAAMHLKAARVLVELRLTAPSLPPNPNEKS